MKVDFNRISSGGCDCPSRLRGMSQTLARSGCHSAVQRNVAGHEHCSGSNRPTRHQSAHVRHSTPSRCSIGRGHHSVRSSMPQCRDHERSRFTSCAYREDGYKRRGDGRRWSDEAMQFSAELAACKAREALPVMRFSTFLVWQWHWKRMIGRSSRRRGAFQGLMGPQTQIWLICLARFEDFSPHCDF